MDPDDVVYIFRSAVGCLVGVASIALGDAVSGIAPSPGVAALVLAIIAYVITIPIAFAIYASRDGIKNYYLVLFKGVLGYFAAWFIGVLAAYNS